MEENYANAYVEVLEVLNNLRKEDFNKIPEEYLIYLKENSNKDFVFKYDISKELNEQNLSEEAKIILFFFFEKFGASESQKKKIKNFKTNAIAQNYNDKVGTYNYDDLFLRNKKIQENSHNTTEKFNNSLIIKKNTRFLSKIFAYIKRFFTFKS